MSGVGRNLKSPTDSGMLQQDFLIQNENTI